MTKKRFTMYQNTIYEDGNIISAFNCMKRLNDLYNENEQLKQENVGLMRLLENQSIIIHELHSKLMSYQLKEPITLTKEDLELMDKAVSYYTHGRCGE